MTSCEQILGLLLVVVMPLLALLFAILARFAFLEWRRLKRQREWHADMRRLHGGEEWLGR
jgi:hypothetical protein